MPASNSDRQQKIAVITGASSGIGRAIAHRLASEGYVLAICARRRDRLVQLAQDLPLQSSDVLYQAVDLRHEPDIVSFFSRIQDQWGGVDVLVNNAGVGRRASLMQGETAGWQEMLDVNVLALCICTREAIRLMHQQGDRGHIIHISSMSGYRIPGATSSFYAATKFAVRALTEGLRQELRAADSQIKVSAVSPGFVETEFAEKLHQSAEKASELYSRFPVLQPADIAEAVWYLLSQPQHVQVHDILLRPTLQTS